jgi:signal transduction histidine kinase/ActR/RegA family two-component response regulator
MNQQDQGEQPEISRQQAHYLEVIHEFALSQVNLDKLDDIVWNVTRTAIAQLGFVDCIVYLLDESGGLLVQRAAHGPKNPAAQSILNPIAIPVGKGIVGSVAATGRMEKVDDTRRDCRYITDDAQRLSELAVPIIHQGRVIGVLDSEHPDPAFFTDDHVRLLTTIASLASTRIETALTMERLEATITRLQDTERTLAAQAEQLSLAKSAADRASSEKSRFLANLSHEIRTPMTAIVGYADLLTRPGNQPEQQGEWAEQLRRNADHLLGLVNDVLDVSKIESGKLSPDIEPCDFEALVADVCGMTRPVAEAKGLEFTVHQSGLLPRRIETDALRLRQTLLNLISNAIKYTRTGTIGLHLEGQQNAANGDLILRFAISDTGIGIDPANLESIFEPFTKLKHHAQPSEGSGLGLSISRSFARVLGGDIQVNSQPGQGSKFTLVLNCGPVDRAACMAPEHFSFEPRKRRPRRANASLSGRSIFLVEDSAAIAGLVRHLLESAGAEVRYAGNGELAVREILADLQAGTLPDLVIMDMLMPVMDGYTATALLRGEGVAVPIVALTAFALDDDREKCLAAGCNAYLSKPLNPATFIDQVASCLGTRGMQK